MKKIYATKSNTPVVSQHRPFRRFVKKLFSSFIKRQNFEYRDGFQTDVIQKLKNLEDKIEVMTRKMVRRTKPGP